MIEYRLNKLATVGCRRVLVSVRVLDCCETVGWVYSLGTSYALLNRENNWGLQRKYFRVQSVVTCRCLSY